MDDGLEKAIFDGLINVVYSLKLPRLRDAYILEIWARKRAAARNPLLRSGKKYFSQNDEDGILLEICRRTGLKNGTFVEIGVGNGLENNTLILLMSGWQGVWLGAEQLAFKVPDEGPLLFQESWITRENCCALVSHGVAALGKQRAEILSVDLDGNDLYVIEALLAGGIAPDIVVAEYNAKFPPPIRWAVPYDPNHKWDGTDYFGASLQSLLDVLGPRGYRLVCCNITGVNAFFVKQEHAAAFADVPAEAAELFEEADYNWFVQAGHPPSPRTIESFLTK